MNLPNLDNEINASLPPQRLEDFTLAKSLNSSNDIIDLAQINFSDDENWLCKTTKVTENLDHWLHAVDLNLDDSVGDLPSYDFRGDLQKNFDTRTFTRPKKRFTRPSIERYNEELYGDDTSRVLIEDGTLSLVGGDITSDLSTRNLNFDLSEPMKSHYFDSILANSAMCESFTNMSPPSLVNSMCSSTFANLMENSLIKSDPILREIRDTDYTESILLQETEPMFQSVTGSCSSLNSDVPENYLKKVSYSEGNKNATLNEQTKDNRELVLDDVENYKENQVENFNSTTYQRKSRTKATFRVADINAGTITLNGTFQRRKNKSFGNIINTNDNGTNETFSSEVEGKGKRLLDRRPMDLNRLSYLVDSSKNDELNAMFDNKRNSFGSTDSAENIDYMSVSSASSKSSTKILSMEGLNHIVEMQERSLDQIMSTPKPNSKKLLLWEHNVLSPISGRISDPELSSSDAPAFRAVEPKPITKQRSLGQLSAARAPARVLSPRRQIARGRGSAPNLAPAEARPPRRPGSNLNAMGHALKGSYTSLKPINPNLPVAPPLDGTFDVASDAHFARPAPPRTSGLPRPVGTGIPRPVSRLPGPKIVRNIAKPAK